tara:strand:+ start:1372 stop:2343 length:972 start_codon:yes stop_codon:yes gene_type:complete
VSGWLLLIFLLLLGGVISSFGDLLGTKIGKARFSIFKLRPKRTATLITIITGSFISASSLSLMLLVNSQLRVGLFRLGDLQKKLQESRKLLFSLKSERETLEGKIVNKEKELTQLERNIIALRSGKVVISSGQSIFISEIKLGKKVKIDFQLENIIKNANRLTQEKVNPNVNEPRSILLLRKNHIDELKKTITSGGDWVINIKSVRNVLEGENYVYAFPELIENKTVVSKDEIISKTSLIDRENNITDVRNKINLLLASTLAEAKRRGSLVNEIKLKSDSVKKLQNFIKQNKGFDFKFEVVSLRDSKTAQPVIVELKVSKLLK